MLPRTFDPTGAYTERQFDRARGFRLLAHAEIEWYLEEIVFETANKAFDDWKQYGSVTRPLLAVVAYVDVHLGEPPITMQDDTLRDLDKRVERSKNRFNTFAKGSNHGIREANILRLLLPVGISASDIDPTWLSTTNSFGRLRGLTAHASNQVYNPPDPRNEFEIVNQVIEGLSNIDARLVQLQSR